MNDSPLHYALQVNTSNHSIDESIYTNLSTDGKPEIVLLAAAPASGKSTIARKMSLSHSFVRVNQDELGSLPACTTAAKKALTNGQCVVVDNTNFNPQTRQTWIALAKEMNVKVSLSVFICLCVSQSV